MTSSMNYDTVFAKHNLYNLWKILVGSYFGEIKHT